MSVLTNIISALVEVVSAAKSVESSSGSSLGGSSGSSSSVSSKNSQTSSISTGTGTNVISDYDDRIIKNSAGYTDGVKDSELITAYQTAWQNAKSQAEKDAYHEAAETIRSKYGYGGGSDGSMYIGDGSGYSSGSYASSKLQQSYYPSFLSMKELNKEYEEIASQQITAINNSVSSGVNILKNQKESVNEDFDELARTAYISNRISKMNLPQQLSAAGISGGAAESTTLGLLTNYENNLNENERQRLKSIQEIEDEITNLKLEGKSDIATIKANASMAALEAYQKQLESELDYYKWQQDYDLDKESFDYSVKSDTASTLLSQLKYSDEEEQQEYENALSLAKIMASYGDFSMFEQLGIDSSLMESNYAASKTKSKSSSSSSDSSSNAYANKIEGMVGVKTSVIDSIWDSAGSLSKFYERMDELMESGVLTKDDVTTWMLYVAGEI